MIVGYELAVNTVAALTVAPYSEIQSGGARRMYVREIGLFCQAATAAGKTVLGRPGNTPTVGALTVGGAQDPSNAAATGGVTTTWTVVPTVPAPAMRQFDLAATLGSGAVFTWPSDGELVIGITRNLSLIAWNASGSTGPILSQYQVWGE